MAQLGSSEQRNQQPLPAGKQASKRYTSLRHQRVDVDLGLLAHHVPPDADGGHDFAQYEEKAGP